MSERTNIQATTQTLVAITATRPATFDQVGYQDTDLVFQTLGEVENVGEHGVQAEVIRFIAVNDGVVQKLKGPKDYGTMPLVLGHVPSNLGQALAAAAAESQNRYSIRLTYPLGDGESTPEIHYLDVLVTSFRFTDGTASDVRRANCSLELCRAPVIVDAT